MKLLKNILKGFNTILDGLTWIVAVLFVLMALSGMITFGCSKSWFYDQTACTITMIFNTLK